jgi:probable rRNA maturation factor
VTDLALEVSGINVTTVDAADEAADLQQWGTLLGQALAAEGVSAPAEVTLVFIDVDEMTKLNAEHMGEDGATDVLSFPLDDVPESDDMPRMVGDIVLCLEYAKANALTIDPSRQLDDEIALLIVHGALHLLGHDHAEDDEKATMRGREQFLLTSFFRPGTHPDDQSAAS